MNVEQVRQLGHTLKAKAEEINAIISEVNSVLGSTTWEGPDADGFRNTQWPEHRNSLQTIATNIDGFGQSALNNAQEQSDVSSR